jgi:DNA polymerase
MVTPREEELVRELATLTDATRRLCKLHGTLGLDYPRTAALTGHPVRRQARAAAQQAATQTSAPPAPPAPILKKMAPTPSGQEIAVLQDTISHCERCIAEAKRPTPLFGIGRVERPTLLLVGDAVSDLGVRQGEVFPGPEGELLGKMLAAIQIDPTEVFQASIIRCTLDPSVTPLAGQVQNCRPHLVEQIKLLQPMLICTMGQLASQALIGTKNTLAALRGRFHQFDAIPLMATYHPGQLLLVPDLKKAAWYDLQLIQHKLKELRKA